MTALSPITDLISAASPSTNTQSAVKAWFTDLRAYLNDLFGSDGTKATARTTLFPIGSSGQVITSNGTDWAAATPAASGKLVQEVTNYLTGYSSITSNIPFDDTPPQDTEGSSVVAQAITPTNAANKLVVDYCINAITGSGGTGTIVALFKSGSSNAVQAQVGTGYNTHPASIVGTYEMTAGTTSAITFTVRAGDSSGVSTTTVFNCNSSGAAFDFGGLGASWIRVREIAV